MNHLPVACTLGPAALKARREGLLAELSRRANGRVALPNGLRLTFAAAEGMMPLIARAVDNERECCRFLHFTVTVEPDGGPIALELTGPPGTRDFVSALLDD